MYQEYEWQEWWPVNKSSDQIDPAEEYIIITIKTIP